MKHKSIISRMTLEEKCAMLSGADVWHTHAIDRLSIPAMTLSDGPSGLRKQAASGDHLGLNASTKATCIPSAATLANSWSIDVAEAMGEVVGADAAAQDVQVLLGPGLNTKRSSLCGRAFEYYSEDPYLAGKMAAGFIRGVQRKGVNACAKHFCANSQELLRMHSDSVVDERTLREIYLTNFEIAVKEGKPKAIMTSYNQLNGTYTNEDPHLLKDILGGEWGFDGMVVTDWGGSNSYVEGVRAGMNLEMPAAGADSPCQLMEAIKRGDIAESVIDQRVDELLGGVLAKRPDQSTVDPDAQHEAVRKAAEKCIVLLKNEGNILPLRTDVKVAVIGDFAITPRYQGAGSSMVNAERLETVATLLPTFFTNCAGCVSGFERLDHPKTKLLQEALELAQRADVVLLYLGLPEGFETEGLDRSHMRLPQNQIDLLGAIAAVNPNIVVSLSAGSAVEMPWADQCKAIVFGALGGQAAASAMLNVLTGKVNPSGKLSESFPMAYNDLPVSRYYPGKEKNAEYREGLYVGYRYLTTAKKNAKYPFGHGLSYTSFAYSDLVVTESAATFSLENTGKVDGDEIVQLYVRLPEAKVFRPAMELKGFARVSLKAGEKQSVTIPYDEYTFRYFNVKSGKYEVEGGMYEVCIAASSEDVRLRDSLHVAGTDATAPYAEDAISPYLTGDVMDVPDAAFQALLGRPIPAAKWDRAAPLSMNDTICQMAYAKNPLCRMVAKRLGHAIDRAVCKGKPDLNLLFIYNMPFRGMAKLMNGMISMRMAEDILFIANGHFFRGAGRLIRDFFHRPSVKYKESGNER